MPLFHSGPPRSPEVLFARSFIITNQANASQMESTPDEWEAFGRLKEAVLTVALY